MNDKQDLSRGALDRGVSAGQRCIAAIRSGAFAMDVLTNTSPKLSGDRARVKTAAYQSFLCNSTGNRILGLTGESYGAPAIAARTGASGGGRYACGGSL